MRWIQLSAPEGALYVDLTMVSAIGPAIRDKGLHDETVTLRALYLTGGQCVVIFDTAENMSLLFETGTGRLA